MDQKQKQKTTKTKWCGIPQGKTRLPTLNYNLLDQNQKPKTIKEKFWCGIPQGKTRFFTTWHVSCTSQQNMIFTAQ